MSRLVLFGSYHFNRRSVVTADFREVAAEADAIAVEYPVMESVRALLAAALYAPLVYLGGNLLYLFVQGPLMVLAGRDVISTECSVALSIAGDRDVHFVDQPSIEALRDRSLLWAVGNWTAILALLAYEPTSVSAMVGLTLAAALSIRARLVWGRRWLAVALFAVTWAGAWSLLLAGVLAWYVVPAVVVATLLVFFLTAHDRNHAMLVDCSVLFSEHDYDELCLATGKAHLPGMAEVVDEYGLEIADAFVQRWFRRGRYVDPGAIVQESGTMNLGVSADPERTDGVLVRRAVGALVDGVVVLGATVAWFLALLYALNAAFGSTEPSTPEEVGAMVSAAFVVAIAILALPVGYFVYQEHAYGQTLGHRIAGLEVVSLDGGRVSLRQATLRTIGRLFDFLPVAYLVGFVVARSGDGSRRLGDLRSGTAVVRCAED